MKMEVFRLKVGQTIKKGQIISVSKAGNLKPYITGRDESIMGTALMKLRRGRIAVMDMSRASAMWREDGAIDPLLTEVSVQYLNPGFNDFISEALLPKVGKK